MNNREGPITEEATVPIQLELLLPLSLASVSNYKYIHNRQGPNTEGTTFPIQLEMLLPWGLASVCD